MQTYEQVLEENRALRVGNAALKAQVAELTALVAELKARIAQLEAKPAKANRNSSNSSKPPPRRSARLRPPQRFGAHASNTHRKGLDARRGS